MPAFMLGSVRVVFTINFRQSHQRRVVIRLAAPKRNSLLLKADNVSIGIHRRPACRRLLADTLCCVLLVRATLAISAGEVIS
jgi:hypothetical protein